MKRISVRKSAILIIIFFTCSGDSTGDITEPIPHAPPTANTADNLFFNTQFLAQYDLVAKILLTQKGFEEIRFIAHDGIELHGLWRKHPHASYSILFCAGFYPGRKEGLASFIEIAPTDCNLLFFDARGHGKSGGRFFSNLHNYGVDEYKDIIGALDFIKKETNMPIFIHGICAGAFNAAHAIAHINTKEYRIKGLIFDSGILSIPEACHVPEKYFCQKIIAQMLSKLYPQDTKKTIQERLLYKILSFATGKIMNLATVLIKPFLESNEAKTKLTADHFMKIQCPLLFIHSYDDGYVSLEEISQLAATIPHAEHWWLENSEHALHHLKHTDEYQRTFINFVIKNI
jgi:pimeloyl-ACP methyl ester carboxylesterase